VSPAKVGVAFSWHCLAWEELVALVLRAEALGYDTAYIDGDVSQLALRREIDVLDGWTATTALIARTQRIRIASIRLVQHWNAAHLAQVAATAERIAPGRLHFFVSIGDRPEDRAWGLPLLPPSERVAWLDETLDAVRALWRGESVTRRGRHVALEEARVRPVPPGGQLPIEVAAKGARLLAVVARHADVWNVNWPAIPARVEASASELARACHAIGRRPARSGAGSGSSRAPNRSRLAMRSRSSGAGIPGSATSRMPSSRPRSRSESRPSVASESPRRPRSSASRCRFSIYRDSMPNAPERRSKHSPRAKFVDSRLRSAVTSLRFAGYRAPFPPANGFERERPHRAQRDPSRERKASVRWTRVSAGRRHGSGLRAGVHPADHQAAVDSRSSACSSPRI